MSNVSLIYSEEYLNHDTQTHPEQPSRISEIRKALESAGLWGKCRIVEPRHALRKDLLRVHSEKHIRFIESTRGRAPGNFDPDTFYSGQSAQVARLAAGGVLSAVDEVLSKKADRSFAIVRPPGHHATPNQPMGFCLYNNIAIGVRYLQNIENGVKIGIIDFDAHHGNGTQETFYDDPNVFYLSLHDTGIFPGTGRSDEVGNEKAKGTNHNVPLSDKITRDEYLKDFKEAVSKVCHWEPEYLFISAGFDSHEGDPLARLPLESSDFAVLTDVIIQGGRQFRVKGIISVLEGGYNLKALGESACHHVRTLLER